MKLYANWLFFINLSIAIFALILTLWFYFTNSTFASNNTDFLLYQGYINAPTLLFMIPYFLYTNDLEKYIAATYPDLYYPGQTLFAP